MFIPRKMLWSLGFRGRRNKNNLKWLKMGIILNENGEVLRIFVSKDANSIDDKLLSQTQFVEERDVQTVEVRQHAGFQSRPPAGSNQLVTKINNSFRVSVAEDDNIIVPGIDTGETAVYSSGSGTIQAKLLLKNDGKTSLGNGTDELLSLFDEMLTELQKTVDLTGSASTGTLFKINPALANIQSRLGNIKI